MLRSTLATAAVALSAGAGFIHTGAQQAPPVPPMPQQPYVYPMHTFTPRLPMQCSVIKHEHAQQFKQQAVTATGGRVRVREVIIFKMDCPKGERISVRRGPWRKVTQPPTSPPMPNKPLPTVTGQPTPVPKPGTPTQAP